MRNAIFLDWAVLSQRRAAFSYATARMKFDEGDFEVAAMWQVHAADWSKEARDDMTAFMIGRSRERRSDLSE